MRCPFCAHDDTQVKDSRPTEDNASIRRRRQCSSCGARFTTFERVQLREVVVVKSGDRREPFDRSKLEQSIALASRKRGIDQERLDQLWAAHARAVSGIEPSGSVGRRARRRRRRSSRSASDKPMACLGAGAVAMRNGCQ